MIEKNKTLIYLAVGASFITTVARAGSILIKDGDSTVSGSKFYFKHGSGWNERYIFGEDTVSNSQHPGQYIDISSKPYPGDTSVVIDRRNKESTLPSDLIVMLTGQSSADGGLYVSIPDANGYEHRNLTIQEIPDPNNPDNPNNPNLEYDIRDRWQNYGGYVPGSAPLQENVPRYWRVRVYTKLKGDVDENGQVDHNDLKKITGDNWLKTTHDSNDNYVGNNYDVGDRNHDGWNDFLDFTIIAKDWWMTEDGNSISKLTVPGLEGKYLAAFQESAIKNFYGDKAKKVRIARLVAVPKDISQNPNYRGGIIPQLSQGTYQNSQKPTLNQLLALSNNGHNGDLSRHYSTIDDKLPLKNQRTLRLT
jgi:hypothetical protein